MKYNEEDIKDYLRHLLKNKNVNIKEYYINDDVIQISYYYNDTNVYGGFISSYITTFNEFIVTKRNDKIKAIIHEIQ